MSGSGNFEFARTCDEKDKCGIPNVIAKYMNSGTNPVVLSCQKSQNLPNAVCLSLRIEVPVGTIVLVDELTSF
jgi:hypothetical protein